MRIMLVKNIHQTPPATYKTSTQVVLIQLVAPDQTDIGE